MFTNQYKIRIIGKNPRTFFKYLLKLKINLYQVEMFSDYLEIVISKEDYTKLKKMKTSYQMEVIDRFGLVKFSYFLNEKKYFITSVFISFFLLFFLSRLIFSVEIEHSNQKLSQYVLTELEKKGVKKWHFQLTNEKKENIVNQMLVENKNLLEWLELDRIGTKYIVRFEERKKIDIKEEGNPQNIVARKDGIIYFIEASKGEVVSKKNAYVKKGDILITGLIKNQEEEMARVRAEGKVIAETWYQTTVEMPLYYKEEYLTGEKKKVFTIRFLSNSYHLFDKNTYRASQSKNLFSITHDFLPLSLSFSEEYEVNRIEEIYTKESALIKAEELASEKLLKSLGENSEIISQKVLKIQEKESKIIVDLFFKVHEDITAGEEIPTNEEPKQE